MNFTIQHETAYPRLTALAKSSFLAAVVLPIWAFFNIDLEFPPMVGDDHGVTAVNSPVEINLAANDADPDGRLDCSKVTIVESPAHGIVSIDPQTAACTYAPALNYVGRDRFSYQIRDNEDVTSNIAVVTVDVKPTRPSK